MAANLRLTAAAAELGRQAAVAGTPGEMHLELRPGECADHVIHIRPGHLAGIAVARADGVTLHAPSQPAQTTGRALPGLPRRSERRRISDPQQRRGPPCACGSAFSRS